MFCFSTLESKGGHLGIVVGSPPHVVVGLSCTRFKGYSDGHRILETLCVEFEAKLDRKRDMTGKSDWVMNIS